MKNFVLLFLVLVFGVIVSTSVSAQGNTESVTEPVQTLAHQEQIPVLPQSCENCTRSSIASTAVKTPVKFVQRIACSASAHRVAQAPSRFGQWVKRNRPVRSTIRNAVCRLRCR